MSMRIECTINTQGQLRMRLLTAEDGHDLRLRDVLISRPPRMDLLDPNIVFLASLLLFGPRLSSDITTNLDISESTRGRAEEIWKRHFTVETDDGASCFAAQLEPATTDGRTLQVTARSLSMARREDDTSVLQVLPSDLFTGTLSTLFDLAVTSNAGLEGQQLYGDGGETVGAIAVASCFAPAFNASVLSLHDDLPLVTLDEAQLSTLGAMGIELRFQE